LPQVLTKCATAIPEGISRLPESPIPKILIDPTLLKYNPIYIKDEEPLASGTAAVNLMPAKAIAALIKNIRPI
jgi:hypothetical protein